MGAARRRMVVRRRRRGLRGSRSTCSTSRSSRPRCRITASSRAAAWPIGRATRCFVYGSTQSQTAVVPNLARLAGVEPDNLVYIAEFCGGGFGSKINAYPVDGRADLHGEENRHAGADAREPRRGGAVRLVAARVPGPHQDGLPRRRPHHGRRSVHRSAERAVQRRRRSRRRGRRRLAALSAARDALPRRAGQHEHDADGRAARPRVRTRSRPPSSR